MRGIMNIRIAEKHGGGRLFTSRYWAHSADKQLERTRKKQKKKKINK